MPSTLTQRLSFARVSQKNRQYSDTTRPNTLAIDTEQPSQDVVELSRFEETCRSKSSSNLTPLQRIASFKGRRSFFSRRRSQPSSLRSKSRSKHASSSPSPVHHLTVTRSSTVPQRRPNSFRDVAKHFVPASLQRSTSLTQVKHKPDKSHNQLVSPLVTATKGKDFRGMGRRITTDCVPLANGTRDEENNPASVESFVRKCADCFEASGNCSNEHFLRILFLTHPWFMTSEQLMVLFSKLYEEEKSTDGYRSKIFFTIRFWMNECPHMFDLDAKLVVALRELQDISANDPNVDRSLIDLDNKRSYKWMSAAQMSIRPTCVDRKQRKVSLVFNHLEPEDIAVHMSYLEYNCFRRLTLSDFHNYAVNGVIKNNLKLERAVFLFNNITHWVQCMVLDHHNVNDRALAIVKFVEVAKKLHSIQNFNTLMAIVGALTHTAISRLKKTMADVPKATQKTLQEYVELLDSKANYSCYRRAYKKVVEEFKIPVIGILMKDLTALHAALPDRVGDGLINVKKMMMIGRKYEEIYRLQKIGFPFTVNRDLVNTLRVSLYLYYNEEEIYQLSVRREPRDVKYSTSGLTASPTKLTHVGFSEFARFTCQVDDVTIKQHVTAMVNSVFKTYDLNSDGFISEYEFGCFIRNFPGLDPFATVDKDKDGRISLEEMVDYFMKISSARRNQVCQSFKHDFSETTYFHPTFCEECDRLLWGLVKQGWKCKDCGINCHKHCKDRIVQECRPKSDTKGSNFSLHSHKKQAKEKASLSSESDLSVNGDHSKTSNEEDPFEGGEGKIRSLRKKFSSAAFKSSYHTPTKKWGKPSSSSKYPRKSSSPNLGIDSSRKIKGLNLLLKRSSPKLGLRSPESLAVEGKDAVGKSTPMFYKKANSMENVSVTSLNATTYVEIQKNDVAVVSETALAPEFEITSTPNSNAKASNSRQDSGIVTPSTSSTPHTPLSVDQCCVELRFQYPNPPSVHLALADDIEKVEKALNNNNVKKSICKQSEKLIKENQDLRRQLKDANDVIKDLESRLVSQEPKS